MRVVVGVEAGMGGVDVSQGRDRCNSDLRPSNAGIAAAYFAS
jgi:hypothetical protein